MLHTEVRNTQSFGPVQQIASHPNEETPKSLFKSYLEAAHSQNIVMPSCIWPHCSEVKNPCKAASSTSPHVMPSGGSVVPGGSVVGSSTGIGVSGSAMEKPSPQTLHGGLPCADANQRLAKSKADTLIVARNSIVFELIVILM